tara:strand:+ start:732 stop:1289 length:558 start_codon:yes stop_codon:yes gene_type:complete
MPREKMSDKIENQQRRIERLEGQLSEAKNLLYSVIDLMDPKFNFIQEKEETPESRTGRKQFQATGKFKLQLADIFRMGTVHTESYLTQNLPEPVQALDVAWMEDLMLNVLKYLRMNPADNQFRDTDGIFSGRMFGGVMNNLDTNGYNYAYAHKTGRMLKRSEGRGRLYEVIEVDQETCKPIKEAN